MFGLFLAFCLVYFGAFCAIVATVKVKTYLRHKAAYRKAGLSSLFRAAKRNALYRARTF